MNFYTIYTKKDNKIEEPIIVKEGFNWYSLIFNIFWALYKRVWILALVYIILQIIFVTMAYIGVAQPIIRTITLVIYIIIAFHANDFYRYTLKNKGYILTDVVLAKSPGHVLYNFLKNPHKS